jgi:hypothetical protein
MRQHVCRRSWPSCIKLFTQLNDSICSANIYREASQCYLSWIFLFLHLSVNCLTIDRHYWHSWHAASRHWHSYRQPVKCQLTNQCHSLLTFYWHISYTDKVCHMRHSKMLLSIACQRKMSQLCCDRQHGDMLATYHIQLIRLLLILPINSRDKTKLLYSVLMNVLSLKKSR